MLPREVIDRESFKVRLDGTPRNLISLKMSLLIAEVLGLGSLLKIPSNPTIL